MARSKGQKSCSERSHRESASARNPAKTLGPERQKAPTCVGALSYWRWTQSAANLYRACNRFGRSFSCSEISGERWVHLAGHPLKNKYARTPARAKKGFRPRTLQAPHPLVQPAGSFPHRHSAHARRPPTTSRASRSCAFSMAASSDARSVVVMRTGYCTATTFHRLMTSTILLRSVRASF